MASKHYNDLRDKIKYGIIVIKDKVEYRKITKEDIQKAIDDGFDIDEKGDEYGEDDGKRLLHHAAERGNTEAVRLLVKEFGVYVDTRDRYYRSACMWAAKENRLETVEVLVEELGADINAQDNGNNTPWMYAAYWENWEILYKFVGWGADLSMKDQYEKTVFTYIHNEDVKKEVIALRKKYEAANPDKPKMADDLAKKYLIPQEKIAVKNVGTAKNGEKKRRRAVRAANNQGHPMS